MYRRLLRPLKHRNPLSNIGVRLTNTVGAGAVGVITRLVATADVHHHNVPGPQFTIRALMVRVGPVWAGTDDDESHLRMPLGHNRFSDIRGHLRLRAPRNQ